jgi:hypothetical protein
VLASAEAAQVFRDAAVHQTDRRRVPKPFKEGADRTSRETRGRPGETAGGDVNPLMESPQSVCRRIPAKQLIGSLTHLDDGHSASAHTPGEQHVRHDGGGSDRLICERGDVVNGVSDCGI